MKYVKLSKYRSYSLVAKYQKGVTMIEYALIASLIAVIGVATLTLLGNKIVSVWTNVTAAL